MKDITIIIPSLNPDRKILEVVDNLIGAGFEDILIVNDGSREDCFPIFDQLAEHPECTILRHNKNLGKGRGLKTAFNYYLNNRSDSIGVVTVDGDNQHHTDDIVHCAETLRQNPNSLILGVRNFNEPGIPFRSRFGNKLTSFTFRFVCGLKISDTQTGLRAIPRALTREFLDLYGERFEYETSMLLQVKKSNFSMIEVPIRTIYLDDNATSHFNPVLDSLRIYRLLFKFISSSVASLVIDLFLFWLILKLQGDTFTLAIRLLTATVAARVVSSLVNYTLNRKAVFGSDQSVGKTMARYYTLCVLQMFCSYGGVYLLSLLWPNAETVCKILVDFVLFLISFQIQREWVFQRKKGANR